MRLCLIMLAVTFIIGCAKEKKRCWQCQMIQTKNGVLDKNNTIEICDKTESEIRFEESRWEYKDSVYELHMTCK